MNIGWLRPGAVLVIALNALAQVPAARAATLTFETAPFGANFTGPVTENGFTYALLAVSGGLYVNNLGDPGQDMEGQELSNGGVLDIVSSSAGDFTFSSLDFVAANTSGTFSQTLTASGYLNGALVGTDTFTRGNQNVVPFVWQLESASNLAGVKIDDLRITLDASVNLDTGFFSVEAIDNVTLFPVGAPEPAAWAQILAGFAGLGMALRARRQAPQATFSLRFDRKACPRMIAPPKWRHGRLGTPG